MTRRSMSCSVRPPLSITSAYIAARLLPSHRVQPALPLPLHRLIDLIAEDNAIEDTMYHLHRALNAGRIDLERFLRVNLIASTIQLVLLF